MSIIRIDIIAIISKFAAISKARKPFQERCQCCPAHPQAKFLPERNCKPLHFACASRKESTLARMTIPCRSTLLLHRILPQIRHKPRPGVSIERSLPIEERVQMGRSVPIDRTS
jgi:hypothetical protein